MHRCGCGSERAKRNEKRSTRGGSKKPGEVGDGWGSLGMVPRSSSADSTDEYVSADEDLEDSDD